MSHLTFFIWIPAIRAKALTLGPVGIGLLLHF
jgi:hypothetical protein